jgi:hypothetical protein
MRLANAAPIGLSCFILLPLKPNPFRSDYCYYLDQVDYFGLVDQAAHEESRT